MASRRAPLRVRGLSVRPRIQCSRPQELGFATVAWNSHAPVSSPGSTGTQSLVVQRQRTRIGGQTRGWMGQKLAGRSFASAGSSEALRQTALYDLHLKHGGKMVPFGGFDMPVQYSDLGIGDSHRWTRQKASLFDVGHMVQHELSGPGAEAFLQRVTPSSIRTLGVNHSTLSCFLHEGSGGIVDDTVITRRDNGTFYFVTNAACRDKDCDYLASEMSKFQKDHPGQTINWDILDQRGLVAIQGPLAADILTAVLASPETDDLSKIYFGQCKQVDIKTKPGHVVSVLASRGGYTGEDGFELSIPDPSSTAAVTETLLDSAGPEKLRLAGLGARDSLRLEAGMCLYGHDLDDTTTPPEGALAWVVGKDRRAEGGFHGADTILAQIKAKNKGGRGVDRRRVGLVIEGAPAREGASIVSEEGEEVGKVTSGCPSPTTGKNVAMGYVRDGLHKTGTELYAVVRGKKRKAVVTKMPFVETHYHKEAPSPA